MESVGAMSEGEWSSFNGMYSTEEADFMAQLLGNCSLPNEAPNSSNFGVSPAMWPTHESEGPMYSSDETSANMYSFSQGSSYSGGSTFFPISSTDHQYYPGEYPHHPMLMRNDSSVSINYYIPDGKNTRSSDQMYTSINLMEAGDEFLNQDVSNDSMESAGDLPEAVPEGKVLQLGREHEMPVPETSLEDKEDSLSETSKKRPRVPLDVKNKRIVKPKKNQKLNSTDNNDECNKHPVLLRQHSSSCLSEDDSNASHEFNGGAASMSNSKGAIALNLNGKTRASRGSATDPQSLYARKRRERINERLRILQNLVPNGTKVDISTMLEEAVQYVKFLQLQIKLLSSDDLWMYAPIAYNGMDIGLDLKIGTPKS